MKNLPEGIFLQGGVNRRRERAWGVITERFKKFEGTNGFEIPGEVLIGVGTK